MLTASGADAVATLLIAPTGGSKTLAGFLPSMMESADKSTIELHTLYISPLKSLAEPNQPLLHFRHIRGRVRLPKSRAIVTPGRG